MKFPPREYAVNLPYGYWYDPETREEHLFNRRFRRIATRSVDRPQRVAFTGAPKHIDCSVEMWFHNDGNDSHPALSWNAVRRCEKIISRFALGYDVREFVVTGRKDHGPVKGADYRSDEPKPLEFELFGASSG
jgi:hypothetical protein